MGDFEAGKIEIPRRLSRTLPMCPHLATGRKRPFWRTKLSKTTVFPQPGIMTRLSVMIILLAIDQLLRISFNASCKLSGACLLLCLKNSHQILQDFIIKFQVIPDLKPSLHYLFATSGHIKLIILSILPVRLSMLFFFSTINCQAQSMMQPHIFQIIAKFNTIHLQHILPSLQISTITFFIIIYSISSLVP